MRLRAAIIVAALVLIIIAPFAAVTSNNAEASPQTVTTPCQTIDVIGIKAKLNCGGTIVEVRLPEQAPPVVDCDVVVGNQTRVVCKALGQTILSQRLTLPTVTLPPITVTRTVTPPPIRIPGDTVTRTVTPEPRVVPGPTRTVTAEPENNTDSRRGPEPPQPTASITVDGSTPSDGASAEPETETITKTEPGETRFRTVVQKVGWGALASLGIFLLGLIAYIVGYRLGYGDGRKNEVNRNTRWLQNILRRTKRS